MCCLEDTPVLNPIPPKKVDEMKCNKNEIS